MKLHLPCKLLSALLACFCVAATTAWGAVTVTPTGDTPTGGITTDDSGNVTLTAAGTYTVDSTGGTLTATGEGAYTLGNLKFSEGTTTIAAENGASVSAVYDTSSTGSFAVANGTTLTITSQTDTSAGKIWDVLTSWDAEAGDTGLVVVDGTFNANTGDYNAGGKQVNNINGRYQIKGNIEVNTWNNGAKAMTTAINRDAYLNITGDAVFMTQQTVSVHDGTLIVDNWLKLGHVDDGNWGAMQISGDDAYVKVNGINFQSSNVADSNKITMTGGTLAIGGQGIQGKAAKVELLGGTLVAESSWGAVENISFTLGNVTIGSASKGAVVLNGDVSFVGTVTNQNTAQHSEADKGLVLRDTTLTVLNGDLSNFYFELDGEAVTDTNGIVNTYKYWLVRNEGEAKLTLAEGTTVAVGEHNYDVAADGSFVNTNGKIYDISVDSANYSDIAAAGAEGIHLNGGILHIDETAENIKLGITVTGDASITTAKDATIASNFGIGGSATSRVLTIDAGEKTLTLTGDSHLDSLTTKGQIVHRGDVILNEGTGVLTIESGQFKFGDNAATGKSSLQADKIVINDGATLRLQHYYQAADGSGAMEHADGSYTNVELAGTIHAQSIDGGEMKVGALTVVGEKAEIKGDYGASLHFTSLGGEGKLTVAKYSDSTYGKYVHTFDLIKDFHGTMEVEGFGNGKVYINSADQAAYKDATVSGKSYSSADGFTKTGTGSLSLGEHSAEGDITVSGGTLKLLGNTSIKNGGGTLSITNATVDFGDGGDNTLSANLIEVGTGGVFTTRHKGTEHTTSADLSKTDVTLRGGGRINSESQNGGYSSGGLSYGTLSVDGAGEIDFNWGGQMKFAELTGAGTLKYWGSDRNEAGDGHARATITKVKDFNGTVQGSHGSNDELVINGASQDAKSSAIIKGVSKSTEAFTMSGEGSITFENHTAESTFTVAGGTVNLEAASKLTAAGDVTVSGGTLVVNSGATIDADKLNVSDGGTLALASNAAKDEGLTVTLNNGATVAGLEETTTISNSFAYGADANVNLKAVEGQKMVMESSTGAAAGITATGGGTVTLKEVNLAGQNYTAAVVDSAVAPTNGETGTTKVGTTLVLDDADGTHGLTVTAKDTALGDGTITNGVATNAEITAAAGSSLASNLTLGSGSTLILDYTTNDTPLTLGGTLTFAEGSTLDLTKLGISTAEAGTTTLFNGTVSGLTMDNITGLTPTDGYTVTVDATGAIVVTETTVTPDVPPTLTTGLINTAITPEYDAATKVLTFTTDLSVTELSGNVELTFDKFYEISGIVGEDFRNPEGVAITLKNADGEIITFLDNMGTLSINGYDGFLAAEGQGKDYLTSAVKLTDTTFGKYFAESIPEPTTATLSLLALAALAARRRRK